MFVALYGIHDKAAGISLIIVPVNTAVPADFTVTRIGVTGPTWIETALANAAAEGVPA